VLTSAGTSIAPATASSAGIEVELAASADSEEIVTRLKQLYATLEVAVDEQLSALRTTPVPICRPPGQKGSLT
jgi:hypothetical protein